MRLIFSCKNTQRLDVNERFGRIVEKLVGVAFTATHLGQPQGLPLRPRVKILNDLLQIIAIQMGINFCCCNRFVAQHILYGT